MRDTTISRNYAEALLTLAQKAGDAEGWGATISDLSTAMQRDRTLQLFLESPRTGAIEKNRILSLAFSDRLPAIFLRFLQTLVRNRRQMLIPQIAVEYHQLLDEVQGRVHVSVTVAREMTSDDQSMIARRLSEVLGKEVVPHMSVNPEILGGVIVKVGETVMDGSVRRRLASLRSSIN